MGNSQSNSLFSKNQATDQLIQLISAPIESLGYQVIHLELQSHRQKTLRVYIDHLTRSENGIGIEDCVKVSRVLDEFLDQNESIQTLLPTPYELEVSSPGADRPLRTLEDFKQFAGKEVKIALFRPLTVEESENLSYCEKNSKQKNFLGTLMGVQESKIKLSVPNGSTSNHSKKKSKAEKSAALVTNSVEGSTVAIPLHLISKANLEPQFDFEGSDERE